MLARPYSTSEISLLPTGLGNHYTSNNRHLIPPERRKFPYNHANNSDGCAGDPSAPEANMSFREQQDYFGPDVLVIIGLILACLGAMLTLISFYCQFKHPAIQATMAGIGPSLVGIGMLFCVLRLFFCTFFISRTCCECIADGLRILIIRCPFCRKTRKKKIHPLQVKDIQPMMNGASVGRYDKRNGVHSHRRPPAEQSSIEMSSLPNRMEPIHESEEHKSPLESLPSGAHNGIDGSKHAEEEEDDILRDEIDLLEEMKSERSHSPNSDKSLHKNINELVLKSHNRY